MNLEELIHNEFQMPHADKLLNCMTSRNLVTPAARTAMKIIIAVVGDESLNVLYWNRGGVYLAKLFTDWRSWQDMHGGYINARDVSITASYIPVSEAGFQLMPQCVRYTVPTLEHMEQVLDALRVKPGARVYIDEDVRTEVTRKLTKRDGTSRGYYTPVVWGDVISLDVECTLPSTFRRDGTWDYDALDQLIQGVLTRRLDKLMEWTCKRGVPLDTSYRRPITSIKTESISDPELPLMLEGKSYRVNWHTSRLIGSQYGLSSADGPQIASYFQPDGTPKMCRMKPMPLWSLKAWAQWEEGATGFILPTSYLGYAFNVDEPVTIVLNMLRFNPDVDPADMARLKKACSLKLLSYGLSNGLSSRATSSEPLYGMHSFKPIMIKQEFPKWEDTTTEI